MKVRPVELEFIFYVDRETHGRTDEETDRQTNVKKLIVAFRNFASAPKNSKSTSVCLRIVAKLLQFPAWADAVF